MIHYEIILTGGLSLLIALTFALFYPKYRRQLTNQQTEMNKAESNYQRNLLHAVIRSQEQERKRIGMNLHDEVGAALSSLRMMIDRFDSGPGNNVPQCKSVIDRVMTDVRNISHDLSPIRQGVYDFTDALEDRCNAINQSEKLHVDICFESDREIFSMNDDDAQALYRVFSELLNNTIKHAKADRAEIRFSNSENQLIMEYSDNGIGLKKGITRKKGMGMQNIESRLSLIGANYQIDSRSGAGFRMRIELMNQTAKNKCIMEKITVGLVDDQRLFLQSLAGIIVTVPGFELLMEAENGTDCLQQIAQLKKHPDILLIDMEMPGMSGIELNEKIHAAYPDMKVIVLSVYNREKQISRMINAGACGYLEKNCDTSELVNAIQTVHKSGFYMNNTVLNAMRKNPESALSRHHNKTVSEVELTPRETEVLKLICKEYCNSEIAETLFISVRTAEGHRNNLLIKTGSRNTAGLVLFAVKHGYSDLVY